MRKRMCLGICFIFLIGCASEELADLNLQSVQGNVALKKQKEAQLRQAKMLEANAFEQKILAERRLVEQPMQLSTEDPKEISLLTLPVGFSRVSETHVMPPDLRQMISVLEPSATAVWGNANWSVTISAEKSALDGSQINGKTRADFLSELKAQTDFSETSYRSEKKNARTSSKIYDMRNLIVVTVTAVFDVDTQTRTHIRYLFYYRPDYRLSLLIEGKKADVDVAVRDLLPHLSEFQSKLMTIYPDGISFKSETSA